jgi:hypothetical protein
MVPLCLTASREYRQPSSSQPERRQHVSPALSMVTLAKLQHTCSFFLCFSLSFFNFSFSALVSTLPPSASSSSPPSTSVGAATGAALAVGICCAAFPFPPLPFFSGSANSSSRFASSGAFVVKSAAGSGSGTAADGSSPSTKSSERPFCFLFSFFLRINPMRPPAPAFSSSASS